MDSRPGYVGLPAPLGAFDSTSSNARLSQYQTVHANMPTETAEWVASTANKTRDNANALTGLYCSSETWDTSSFCAI